MFRLKLRADSDEKQRWLAPIELWSDAAKDFSELFSDKVILHPTMRMRVRIWSRGRN
jgi:hypothetical protein